MSLRPWRLPMTPQTGHCARAYQALLKELLGKGLARRCHHFGNLFRHLL
jgi:hypothetical protein